MKFSVKRQYESTETRTAVYFLMIIFYWYHCSFVLWQTVHICHCHSLIHSEIAVSKYSCNSDSLALIKTFGF